MTLETITAFFLGVAITLLASAFFELRAENRRALADSISTEGEE